MAIYDIPRSHPSAQTISILLPSTTLTRPLKKRLSISQGHLYVTLRQGTYIIPFPMAGLRKIKEKKATGIAGGKKENWRLADEFKLDAFGPAGDEERSAGGARA